MLDSNSGPQDQQTTTKTMKIKNLPKHFLDSRFTFRLLQTMLEFFGLNLNLNGII